MKLLADWMPKLSNHSLLPDAASAYDLSMFRRLRDLSQTGNLVPNDALR